MPTTFAWLVLLCPLVGTAVIALAYPWLPGRSAGWIGTLAVGLSFGFAVLTLIALLNRSPEHRQLTSTLWSYDSSVGVDAKLQVLVDPLSVFMILIVSGVSALIHLYSVSHMWEDRGYRRYFSYLNFFVFSMLVLVLAGNFVLLIVGWAFVGAASYLLISFWYRRSTATRAGIKAFVINVVGEARLVLGTYFIFKHTATLDFLGAFHAAEAGAFGHGTNNGDLVAGCVLLLVGAFAKSAQIPLHTWLPDAMEGPPPVSALIHAATMVTAGVYLLCRIIFLLDPTALQVIAYIGGFTALLAALIAIQQNDIKRILAYSTLSQLGYMVMAVGLAGPTPAMFHLTTHAFFKALLFLGAGSVIIALHHEQDIWQMGNLRKKMPITFWTFLVGALAL